MTQVSIEVAARNCSTAEADRDRALAGRAPLRLARHRPASGELKILAKALTDAESDALETSIPIVPRGLKVTSAASSVISEDEAAQEYTLKLPANADPNSRRLQFEVAPSVAGTLFGALDYLTSYPYGCTEQTMSSFLPNVVVAQALQTVETASVRMKAARQEVRRACAASTLPARRRRRGWWKDDTTTPG